MEWAFAIVILVAIAGTIAYLFQYNHLPFTFFYDPDDLFADWFNPAYWAYDPGTYDTWRTLYPPLSFAFLRALTNSACYPVRGSTADPSFGLAARECDWMSFVWLGGLFVLNIVLVYLTLRKVESRSALPRTVCVALGWPMLNGLERGNLILVAFTVFLLGFGPLLRSARLKWLCVGLAVNFKVYLIGAVLAPLLKRRWRWSECALLATVIVYLLSYALMDRGTIDEIVTNLQSWSAQPVASPLEMWSATTYEGLYKLLDSDIFPISAIIGSRNVEILEVLLPTLLHGTQAAILIGAAATWLRPEVVPTHRAVNFAVILALISTESGGYTSAMFMMLVMLEPSRGIGRKLAIFLCYLLALPLDVAIDQVAPVVRDTYFRHSTTIITAYVKLGPFIRPLLIQIMAVALVCVTVRDVLTDIRQQGWAGRWRFRADAPILRGIQRPQAPFAT
jgi:hypothetical protein